MQPHGKGRGHGHRDFRTYLCERQKRTMGADGLGKQKGMVGACGDYQWRAACWDENLQVTGEQSGKIPGSEGNERHTTSGQKVRSVYLAMSVEAGRREGYDSPERGILLYKIHELNLGQRQDPTLPGP